MTEKDKNYSPNNPTDRNNKPGKNNSDYTTDVDVDRDKKNEKK